MAPPTAAAEEHSRVELEEIAERARAYATAVSGRDVTIVSADRSHSTQKENRIALPRWLDSERTREETLLEYKILTTLEAGVLRYTDELIEISALPKAMQRQIRRYGKVAGRQLDDFISEMHKPTGYYQSFSSLLQIIEFGRIRQQLRHNYPALDEDIDDFLTRKSRHVELTRALREDLQDWEVSYARQKRTFFGDESRLKTRGQTENELACLDLSYLLLFSNQEVAEREGERLSEKAVRIYQEAFPLISRPGATRTDSVKLTLEILDREFYVQDKRDKKMKKSDEKKRKKERRKDNLPRQEPLPKPLPEYPLVVSVLGLTGGERMSHHLLFAEKEEGKVKEPEITQFFVDEWDDRKKDYIKDACFIQETEKFDPPRGATPRGPRRFEFSSLEVAGIREILEILKPEGKVRTKMLRSGELDFNVWVKYRQAKKLGLNPDQRFYSRVERKERDVAQLILWDISGSGNGYCSRSAIEANMRTIDVQEYGILHYVAALEELGDDIAVLAYHSVGREKVSVYPLLRFGEGYPLDELQRKTGVIAPSFNNCDGAAIRHALYHYLANHPARTKILVHVNDGVPDDLAHSMKTAAGEDFPEYRGEYAIADVKKALGECAAQEIIIFGLSFARETHRPALEAIFGDQYKILKTPYSLGKKLGQVMAAKTLI